jgi:ABC-type glycerol-3-phosphate transport system substrate-binding protein
MVQQGTFLANFIRNQKPSMAGQWAAAPFPAADDLADQPPVTYCNCDVLVIPRGARHKAEAFEFIAYVNSQPAMEKLASLHGKISPLSHVSERFVREHPNPYLALFDELAKSSNARGTEPVPIAAEVQSEMDSFVQQLALLQVTPEQGLAVLQTRLQQKLVEFQARQRARRGGE